MRETITIRTDFTEYVRVQLSTSCSFLKQIFFSNECKCSAMERVNKRNCRVWKNNPPKTRGMKCRKTHFPLYYGAQYLTTKNWGFIFQERKLVATQMKENITMFWFHTVQKVSVRHSISTLQCFSSLWGFVISVFGPKYLK